MVDFPGNVTLAPSFTIYPSSVDDELMYSMKGFTQKGITVKSGQGVLLLGTVMGQNAGDKKWYKYANSGEPSGEVTNEVQSLTEGGSGLTSYTITFSGQTTSSIPAAATAADVQAALIALSNIAPGDVTVTGTTGPIAMTVTFGGAYANTDVAAMTTTPTGGSGTVVVATVLAGGSADGTDTARGFLRRSVDTGTDGTAGDYTNNLVVMGMVKYSKVLAAGNLDSPAITDLAARVDTVLGYVKI